MGQLISNALYDADKFRWGPDNFTMTLWDMLEYANIDMGLFISTYHKGIKGVEEIRETFRSDTGKKYGPEFIEIGLMIGDELYRVLSEKSGG